MGTLRRVPLAGLPLLTIYSVPVSLLGGGVSWIVFTLTTIGFLLMLYLQESRQIARWGRPLGQEVGADPSGFGVSNGALRSSAGAIGAAATALAIVVPLFVPTFGLELFGNGFGPGDGDKIKIENPTIDLKRDLASRAATTPSSRSAPTTPTRRTSGSGCSRASPTTSGAPVTARRRATSVRSATCRPITGLSGNVPTKEYDYQVEIGQNLRLPVAAHPVPRLPDRGRRRLALRQLDDGRDVVRSDDMRAGA